MLIFSNLNHRDNQPHLQVVTGQKSIHFILCPGNLFFASWSGNLGKWSVKFEKLKKKMGNNVSS